MRYACIGCLRGESEGRNVIKLQSHFLRYLEKSEVLYSNF